MSEVAITSTSVYLIPGMRIKIEATLDPESGHGDFARMSTFRIDANRTEDLSLTNGFYVENVEVGDIIPVTGEPAVYYTHKKPEENIIWFIAQSGAGTRRGAVNVISVPIHDHSSIVQGGPGYGTYFSDDDVEE